MNAEVLGTDPIIFWYINFTGNLDKAQDTAIVFASEEAKEITSNLKNNVVKVL